MELKNVLPGKKTIIGAISVFIGGGLMQIGFPEIGGWLVSLGVALGFVGIRYAKRC